MYGLEINSDNDIYVNSSGQFARNSGRDRVAQEVESALRLFLGEWFLNINKGVPYKQEIFRKPYDKERIENILAAKTLEVPSVASVDSISSDFDSATRIYSAVIRGKTIYNSEFEVNLPEII